MVSCTSDNTANLIMLGTQLNEDEILSHTDEILGEDSTTNENNTINQDVGEEVEDEDDDRSSDDDDDQDEDDDDEDEDDLEDDDDDLDEVVPSKSILCKNKNPAASNGGIAGSGAGVTSTRVPSSSQLSQHRKHHHRRLTNRPAVTVGVKVGSSRGLSATKVAGLRARKVTSASCHSPACGVVSSSDEDYEEEVIVEGEVDELDRESDEDDDDDIGPPDFLLPGDGDPGIQGIPPDAQARLEAFFEAAGFTDGRLMSDPESLRKLTMTVSSALGEASAAINRMRDSQRYDETSRRKSLEEGRSDSMEEGDSLLALACSSGYFELARVLLAMGANVDDRGSKGDLTPLMDAASQGHVEIVRLLINHGAEVNAQSACGNSPLMYACAAGHEDIVKELLKSGANVEDNNENGHTPLMEAASAGHVGVAKILLEHGAGINTHSNEFKESALTVACYKGHLDMVKFLLEAGADQQHKTDEMHTALMEASMDGHVEVAKLLLDSGAQVNMPADSFESPLTLAACGGHVELAELLIERGAKIEEVNDEGYTPLMEAAREGHLAVVQCLLQSGAAINSQTEETHETALTLAACGGFLDVVDLLLKSGADIELGASTPLMEAAQEGHIAVVKYLLERNADIRKQTQTGDTALSYACENGHLDVAELLVDVGADPEHFSEGGRTPLMKACRGGHLDVIKFLLQRGANVNRQTTSNDHTPLSLACAGGHVACVEALLAAGANPFHKLKDNSTMIIEAARGGHASVMKILLDFVPANQTKSHASEKAGTPANAKGQPAGKAGAGQKTNDPSKAGAAANQNQAKNSVLRKSRSTSTLDPTPTPQPVKDNIQGKVDTQTEDKGKNLPKATTKGVSNDAQSQKNLNISQGADGAQKQATKQAPTAEKKGAAVAGVCSECGATEGASHHGHETQSTGQASVKRSVRTEPIPPPSPSTQTAVATMPTGPPLVPSQVTAATAISERPKAKANKPSARKQLQQHQGGLSPGSDNGQGSPNGSVSSSSSGLSPVAISSASASALPGTPKTSQQLLNCVPTSVTTSTSVLQMQAQLSKGGVSVATSAPGSSQIKLDSKQLSQLFVQHQQNMKNKTGNTAADPSTSGMGHLGIGTPTTTTVVVHHGESETIIQGDNLPPGTSDLIFNAAAQAFPLEGFPVQCGQITSPSGVHIQSYHQLSAPGTVPSIGVAPLSSLPGGLSGFQQPLLLQHPPPLPAAMTAAAAGAGLLPPSGAPPPGAFKGSNNLPSSKAKESQKSNMSQMVKTLSGTSTVQVQQPQTPVPPVATVAGIQTTKKNLAKRTRPFSNSSGGTQNRQSTQTQTHAHGAHAKQNHAVASTQTNLTGQAADKMLKHLDLDCATESAGETGLSVAAASGHYEVVEFLLSRKAHMEHKDKKGCTPLILAADGGHDKIVELLLAHGAEIEAQSERTKDTALSLACTKGRYEVVEHLLKKGANKEHRNVSDYTPLSLAASGGYVNIIKLLLHHGAEINSRTGSKLGISPLMLAAMNGNTAAVKLLLDMGSDINAQIETNKNTALTLACFQGRQEVVSLLLDRKANLEHRAKTGLTPLMEAANGGYTEVGKILIDRGADVNAAPVPATKDTALTIAADKGHFRFVELLLQRGAMVEVRNKKGCTPLWLACHGGHSDVAQILFKHGADLDAQDNRRVSCLMAAHRKGHVKVIRWIVKNVQQFPSDGELSRFLSSIQNEPDLVKKCEQCEEFIKQAKEKQSKEATRNAEMLLAELKMEQSRDESKRQAAARRREKKKKKKQEKKHGASRDDDDDNDDDEQEEEEESVNVADSGIDANSLGSNSSNGVDPHAARKNNKENLNTAKQTLPEPIAVDVASEIEQAASATSKSRKKKNKKDKDKVVAPAPQEIILPDNSKKNSSKDVLRENENRIAQEEEKIADKATKSKDKRTKKETVAVALQLPEPDKTPAPVVKDSNAKPKKATKVHEAPVLNLPHHPEPLMGISVHPNVRKSGEASLPEANLSHYPPSPNSKTTSATTVGAATLPLGKTGRKDDGWKEVTRSCPSSRSKKVIVPSSVISRVIGRGGCNINAIREATGAHIEVEKQQKGQLQPERTIQIKGSTDATKQAHNLITALMNEPDLDVKKLLPVATSSGSSSVWSVQTHATTPAVTSQRVPTTSQTISSVPTSAPIDTNAFTSVSGKKAAVPKGAPSPVNLSSSPPVKKTMPTNGSNPVVKTSTAPVGKRPIAPFGASSQTALPTTSITSFASKVVPQQPVGSSSNIPRDNSAHTTPTKTTTPTFPTGSPTPPPAAPSPSMTITTNGGVGQMRSPSQAAVAPSLLQYGVRGVKDSASDNSLGSKVYGGFLQQDNSSTSSLTSSLSQSENGGLSAFARTDNSSEERIERPSPQTVPLEYAPFKYQFSKSSSSWYQDDFNQTSTTLTSQLGSPPIANLTQQPNSGLGPVGSTAGLTLNSHGGNLAANRAMNFASVAASGISSNSTTTSAPMSQTGGVQNGNLGSLGGLITMSSSPAKPHGDLFSDSHLPKVDASKAPGYRGNNLNSPSHRVQQQQQPVGPGVPFGGDNLSLPQFGGIIGSQGNQGLGYQNMGRAVNSIHNNPSYASNNSGMGGIQPNTTDFMPRNLSPQSSNVLNYPNSGGQQNAPSSQPRSNANASANGAATTVVLSSRLNPRAPSFTLPHSKGSSAVQPPSQQFSQPMHQQQAHSAFKLGGHLGQFGTRNTAALPNPARTIGGLNLGQQGWSSYGDGSSSTDFQGLAASGQQQSMDQPILSGLESAYEPPGSVKVEDRRSQRAIGPIGAERSLKGNTMGSGMNTLGYSLSQDPVDSVHLGLQQQQNQPMHVHQQHQTSSWGGMFGSSNPPLFPGSNQQHHQQHSQLGNVAPSHLARGNPDIRPFTGNRFLEQVDQSRYLDYHQQQMYDGQRLMNGSTVPSAMLHLSGNLQQTMYTFGMEHNEQQQQHVLKADHLSNSWGDAHLADDSKTMTWSKWGN